MMNVNTSRFAFLRRGFDRDDGLFCQSAWEARLAHVMTSC